MSPRKRPADPAPDQPADLQPADLLPVADLLPADELTTVDALVPDPANRRKHPARNLEMITASLRSVGTGRSIVIDETNEVLAGNGVLEAAPQAGISKVRIIDVDADTIIAVRRTGLSADQKRELAIYDNRSAELAEWDIEQLRADVNAGLALEPFFFEDELANLLKVAAPPAGGFPAVDENLPTEHTCPKCGYEWSGTG